MRNVWVQIQGAICQAGNPEQVVPISASLSSHLPNGNTTASLSSVVGNHDSHKPLAGRFNTVDTQHMLFTIFII